MSVEDMAFDYIDEEYLSVMFPALQTPARQAGDLGALLRATNPRSAPRPVHVSAPGGRPGPARPPAA